jgi:hypothetical protein
MQSDYQAACSFNGLSQSRLNMGTPALGSRVQAAAAEYSSFWQVWPQFEQKGSERQMVGVEVELIGSHASDFNHLDPACPLCHRVRSELLRIAELMIREDVLGRDSLTYNIDSHSNSVVCLPALGNRSAVSVSIYIFWSRPHGQAFETDLLSAIKAFLAGCSIHQR